MSNLKNIFFYYNYRYFFLACREGWYGDNCSQQCVGHCRDNTTCNHVTGQCERGCAAGRTGTFCDNGTEKDDNKIQRKKINN